MATFQPPLSSRRLSFQKYWRLLVAQISLVVIIKVALYFLFINNPGRAFEWHFDRNLGVLSNPASYLQFLPIDSCLLFPSGLNLPLPRGLNMILIIMIVFFVIYGWKYKPRFLKCSLVIVPLTIMLGLLIAFIDESRAYMEIMPVLYLLAFSGLVHFIYVRKSTNSE